uniref:CSON003776 protein n=1 Tax=Culicoides sonorensis TaxID=179676 RepID=A0A336LWH7_CULSO
MTSSIFSLICILSTTVFIEACISYTISTSSHENNHFHNNNNGNLSENDTNIDENRNYGTNQSDNNPLSSLVSGVMLSPLYRSVKVMNTFANNIEGANNSDINDGHYDKASSKPRDS